MIYTRRAAHAYYVHRREQQISSEEDAYKPDSADSNNDTNNSSAGDSSDGSLKVLKPKKRTVRKRAPAAASDSDDFIDNEDDDLFDELPSSSKSKRKKAAAAPKQSRRAGGSSSSSAAKTNRYGEAQLSPAKLPAKRKAAASKRATGKRKRSAAAAAAAAADNYDSASERSADLDDFIAPEGDSDSELSSEDEPGGSGGESTGRLSTAALFAQQQIEEGVEDIGNYSTEKLDLQAAFPVYVEYIAKGVQPVGGEEFMDRYADKPHSKEFSRYNQARVSHHCATVDNFRALACYSADGSAGSYRG
jgi:hypothetical protein